VPRRKSAGAYSILDLHRLPIAGHRLVELLVLEDAEPRQLLVIRRIDAKAVWISALASFHSPLAE